MIIDLLVLTKNRLEFTAVMLDELQRNTNWSLVRSITLVDDCSEDGTDRFVKGYRFPVETKFFQHHAYGSPVAVMNSFLNTIGTDGDVMLKLDSDTVVPPFWLEDSIAVMERNPSVDLLGIEPFHSTLAGGLGAVRRAESARHIGGIGLMRRRCFMGRPLPTPNGRFGFTEWQQQHTSVIKAWINPALQVFLLDRLPIEPFATLSKEYERKGWQRYWPKYDKDCDLWSWWNPAPHFGELP
jgi:glycosyltransferase involved in cell wall biosynthesis